MRGDEIWRADNAFRFDPVDDEWTIIAHNRRVLPPLTVPSAMLAIDSKFDVARAVASLPHIAEETCGDSRAVAVPSPTPLAFVEHHAPERGPYIESSALGAHELLTLVGVSPGASVASLSGDDLSALFTLFASRLEDLARDTRLQRAGLVLPPVADRRSPLVAAMVLALPFLPIRPATSPAACSICADLEHALEHGRVVFADADVVVWIPFAPRGVRHLRVAPRHHGGLSRIDAPVEEESGSAETFATLLGATTARAIAALTAWAPEGDLGLEISPLPLRSDGARCGHVLVDVTGAGERDDGMMRSQGVRVCPLQPEEIAALLRPRWTSPAA